MFPETPQSAIVLLCSTDDASRARGVQVVAEVYWTVIYRHLRRRFHMPPEQAEDVSQAFFLHLVETDLFSAYDRANARFRTYLRHCLDNFAIDTHRKASSKRRRAIENDLDFASVEASLAAEASDPSSFDRDWIRHVAEVAVERTLVALERNNKAKHAELFRRFHLHDEVPSYQSVADELGVTVTDVTNWLHAARREFRTVALSLLREITASEEEFADEARDVFGIDVVRSKSVGSAT